MRESAVQSRVWLRASQLGVTLFRRQAGLFFTAWGERITIGIPGESDLQGYESVVITPEMVGRKIARYWAVETKRTTGGTVSEAQQRFIDAVNAAGGVGIVANSPEALEGHFVSSRSSL